jgi:hypothetical protein
LFRVSWQHKAGITHEEQKKILEIRAKWQPPEGYEIKDSRISTDRRQFSILKEETAEVVSEAIYPRFVVLGEHENVPVADAETAVTLWRKGDHET